MNFNICFRHLVLLEVTSFEKIFETIAQKFPIQCKQSRFKVFFHLLNELVLDSFLNILSITWSIKQWDSFLSQIHSVTKALSKHTNIQMCLATGGCFEVMLNISNLLS